MGFLLLGLLPPPTDDRPTDRPTDRPPPRSELLLAPPLSFFYTHTRHTHVDSLTHTRQTHTRSLTVPFAHGARAGDAHTFAHGALRSRCPSGSLTRHTHSRRTHVRSRCPSAYTHTVDAQHFRLWTVPERVSGPPPLMLPGAALGSLAARFCWQGQHFRLWTVPERVSGPPPLMLPGAALGSLAARFCWQGQHFRLWTVPERVSGPPPLMLPGAALGSLAARFCWQGQLQALDGAQARFGAPSTSGSGRYPSAFRQAQHLGASRLVSAGRGSTSGSGRYPSAFRGRPPLMLPGAALGSLAARFCWQGQHFRLWTVPERVSGPPLLMLPGAALGSLAARFCWQGQHFRLWTVPERVSGPDPPLMLPGAALGLAPPSLMLPGAALGSLAARFCWQGQHFRLWTVPERVSGPPP